MNIPLSYNHQTGEFTWLRRERMARRAMPGDRAGTINSHGYVVITISGTKHKAHRLAWRMFHGTEPDGQIDHINGNRADNRIENLRVVTHEVNVHNRRSANRNSRTGLLGASPGKTGFVATISAQGQRHHLGTFATPEAAQAAYKKAKTNLHPNAQPVTIVARKRAGARTKNCVEVVHE